MRGICEPICDGVSIMGDMGGIAIHFNPGKNGISTRIGNMKTACWWTGGRTLLSA